MHHPSIVKPVLILTCTVIILVGMRLAASQLAPITFALFLAALLTPIYRWLKRRMATGLALLLSIVVMLIVGLFLVLLIAHSVNALMDSLSTYQNVLNQRLAELEEMAGAMGQTSTFQALLSMLDPEKLTQIISFIMGTLGSLVRNSLLILFVTMFALAEGPQFKARMVKAYGADHYMTRDTVTLLDLIINYFGLRAIVNLVVAVCTALVYWLLGIEYAALWGVLIFFLSFIPYLGAFLSTIPPVILGFAQGGLGLAIVIIILTIIINSLSENLLAPLVMGKGLSISPTIVFLSFILWMFILGGLGAFVAMPLTMAFILFLSNFEETRGLAAMMITSSEPEDKEV